MRWQNMSHRQESKLYPCLLLVEALILIENLIKIKSLKKIAITPIGFEDETEGLLDFIHHTAVDFELHIFHVKTLDYIKLTSPDF